MNRLLANLVIAIYFSMSIISCQEQDIDNSYFIEAEIDGITWRGESTGDNLALNKDGSRMKIFIIQSNAGSVSFDFFSNTFLPVLSYYDYNIYLINFVAGAFDSRVKLKWQTTFESNILRFEIERRVGNSNNYETLDSVPARNLGYMTNDYSFTIENPDISHLDDVYYRIRIVKSADEYYYYTPEQAPAITIGLAQIVYVSSNNQVYFAIDNNQNKIAISGYNPNTTERRGTFSFTYLNENGDPVHVQNGKFHIKM